MSHPLLQVVDLTIEREGTVLFPPLTFTLAQGAVIQMTGCNGCGKSSLLKVLCGFITPATGQIFWRNQLILSHDEFSSSKVKELFHPDIIYLGHNNGLKPELTPLENLKMIASMGKRNHEFSEVQVLEKLGLKDYQSKLLKQLSEGQQRRVSLARLILLDATLWILDEPFAALDKASIRFFEAVLLKHLQRGGSAIITTHHSLDFTLFAAHQISAIALDAL